MATEGPPPASPPGTPRTVAPRSRTGAARTRSTSAPPVALGGGGRWARSAIPLRAQSIAQGDRCHHAPRCRERLQLSFTSETQRAHRAPRSSRRRPRARRRPPGRRFRPGAAGPYGGPAAWPERRSADIASAHEEQPAVPEGAARHDAELDGRGDAVSPADRDGVAVAQPELQDVLTRGHRRPAHD